MKIIIISDIHDNIANLEKCLQWGRENKTEELICCGDVCNLDTLEYLAKNFAKTIHLVSGNMELYNPALNDNFKNIKYYGKVGRFAVGGGYIGICHEPFRFVDVLQLGQCQVVFYGHTHKPWQENKKGIRYINPGNVAGIIYQPTFSFWNTEEQKIDLKSINEL